MTFLFFHYMGVPGGSDGKESAFNTGDPGLIPRWGRSPGEGHDHPLQYSCPGNPMDREAGRLQSIGLQRVRHSWSDLTHTHTHTHTHTQHTAHTRTHTHTHRTCVSQGVICQILCALAWWSLRRYWDGAATGPRFWVTMMLIGLLPTWVGHLPWAKNTPLLGVSSLHTV